jgi:hypothetical protein
VPFVEWRVRGTYHHRASGLASALSGTYRTAYGPPPEAVRAELVARIQGPIKSIILAETGQLFDQERVSVTIL